MTLRIVDQLEKTYDCTQCGQEIDPDTLRARQRRGNTETRCKDCTAKPATQIRYGDLKCTPWHGDFDWDTKTCLKNGKPYKVGHRICGHADCVTKTHIIPDISTVIREEFLKSGVLISIEEAKDRIRERREDVA